MNFKGGLTQKNNNAYGSKITGITHLRLVFALLLAVAILLVPFSIYFGAPSNDEGFYSMSTKCFMEGQMPYDDFFFTQTPASLCLFGHFYQTWGQHGVIGRYAAGFFLLAAIVLGSLWMYRNAGALSAILFLGLTGLNPFTLHQGALAMTTAFEVFFLCAIFITLQEDESATGFVVAMALSMLLVAFRISYSPIPLLLLVFSGRKFGWHYKPLLAMIVVAAVVFLLTIGPSLYGAGWKVFLYDNFFYHLTSAGRASGVPLALNSKADFFYNTLKLYLPLLFLFPVTVVIHSRSNRKNKTYTLLGWIAAILILVHTLPTVPQAKYLVGVCFLLAFPVAEIIGKWMESYSKWSIGIALLTTVFVAGELVFYKGFQVDFQSPPVLDQALVAEKIRATTSGEPVFTLDAGLQFEGVNSIPGYNMDIFSIIPAADEETCHFYNVKSVRSILETIKNPQTKYLAFRSEFEFGIKDQDLDAILKEVNLSYRPLLKFPHYGQFNCDLVLLKRRVENVHPEGWQ